MIRNHSLVSGSIRFDPIVSADHSLVLKLPAGNYNHKRAVLIPIGCTEVALKEAYTSRP